MKQNPNQYLRVLSWGLALLLAGCGTELPDARQQQGTPEGVEVGSGGQEAAGGFVEIGYELVEMLIQQPLAQVSAEELLDAVKKTKVFAKPELFLDGKPTDALNFANATPPRIEVSQSGWDRMRRLRHEKVLLVFHEYLGILKKNDTNYQISRRIDRASVCDRTPEIRRYLERELRRSCFRIAIDDLRYVEQIDFKEKKLGTVKAGDFDHLVELKRLDLSYNGLTSLPRGLFRDLGQLEVLDLGGNQIAVLPAYIFAGLNNVKALVLYGNPIDLVERGAFSGIKVSRVASVLGPDDTGLSLGTLFRPRLQTGAFEGLITGMVSFPSSLKTIEPGAFAGSTMSSLHLTLGPNRELLSELAFAGAPEISDLRFEYSGEAPLPPGLFAPLNQTKTLFVGLYRNAALSLDDLQQIDRLPVLAQARFSSYGGYVLTEEQLAQGLPHFECKLDYVTEGRRWGPATCNRKQP